MTLFVPTLEQTKSLSSYNSKSKFSCIAVAIAELYLLFEGKGQTYIIQVVLKGGAI
jgi:hypothetical protein